MRIPKPRAPRSPRHWVARLARFGYCRRGPGLCHRWGPCHARSVRCAQASDRVARHWTAALLTQPFGPWLVGIVGASIIVFGLYQFYYASTTRFCREFYMDELSATAELCITRLGQLGLVARGIVVILIGSFVVHAALEFDANAARGLWGTLRTLEQQPFGPWALGGVALGLTAYGIYMLVEAWYRRIGVT